MRPSGGKQIEFGSYGSFDDETATAEPNGDYDRDAEPSRITRGHRRAMSDPFDTADIGGATDGDYKLERQDQENEAADEEQEPLPTLPRFPVAETRDKNCWSEPPVSIFHVRGANYLDDRKKVAAQKYLLRARGCDLFLADNPQHCVLRE